MDVYRILHELHQEREDVDGAIAYFEMLAARRVGKRRRGRPPGWLIKAQTLQSRLKKGGAKTKK